MAGKRKRPRRSTETVLFLESTATCLNPSVSPQSNSTFADTPSEATFTHSLLHQEHCTPSSSAHQHSHHSSSIEALPVSSVGSFSSNRPHHSLTVDNRRVSFSIPGQTELSGIGTSSHSRESDNSVYLSGISRSESVPGPSTSHTKTRKATSNTSSLHVLTSPPPTEHREKRTVSKKHRPNSPQESFVNYNVASDFGALSEIFTSSGPGTSVAKKRRRDRQNPLSRSPGISCLCLTDKESFLCPAPFSIDLTLRSAHIAPVVSDSGTTFAVSMLSGGVGSNSSKTQSQACTVSSTHHDLRPRHHNVPCVPTPCSLPCGVRQTPSVTAELPHPAQSELMPQRHVFTAPGDVPCARVPSEHVSTAALHHSQQPCTSTDRKRCTGHSAHPLASCSLNPSLPITPADPFSYVPPNSVDLSYLPTPENVYQSLIDANLIPAPIGQVAVTGKRDVLNHSPSTTSVESTAIPHHRSMATTNSKIHPTGSLIPLFSHVPHVSVIVPSTAAEPVCSTKQQPQPILSPINVARLISFNSTHPASRILRSTPHSDAGGSRAAQSLPSTQSTSAPSKYSRHIGQQSSDASRVANSWSRGGMSQPLGRHSPLTTGINHRIVQLQQHRSDRSMQLIILQDINQILLMGFEDNLANLNIPGLVNCILDILDCEEEHLVELKNLGCNVLTHMMDVLPRSADAVVPALPLLLTTMSCSFVGDILERIINLLEQLSRRHGREVLQSGAVASVLGFYDFVTLAQHRTILAMVANCFTSLQRSDFDLLIDCLPSLSERLKESDPRCVERVCTCFARLVAAYRSEPELLKRIVNSCHLFANLQHLLLASPSVLSGVRDVIHMLATLCSSCPELAVDLIQLNISSSLYCILTGQSVDSDALRKVLLEPLDKSLIHGDGIRFFRSINRDRSDSESDRKRSSTIKHNRSGSDRRPDLSTGSDTTGVWQPLMLTASPLRDSYTGFAAISVSPRSQEDIHAIVQLICELLPPIPILSPAALDLSTLPPSEPFVDLSCTSRRLSSSFPSVGRAVCNSAELGDKARNGDRRNSPHRSESDRSSSHKWSDRRRRSGASQSSRLSVPFNQLAINDTKTVTLPQSPVSFGCTGTLTRGSGGGGSHVVDDIDPRVSLLRAECDWLHHQLQLANASAPHSSDSGTTLSRHRRRSSGRRHSLEQVGSFDKNNPSSGNSEHDSGVDTTNPVTYQSDNMDSMHLVQTLLPLLFELFNESIRLQTRLYCLEAIQRMLYYASPVLLAKTLHPRLVCSHLVGMLNCPERRIVLCGLHITLSLIERLPPMFATHFYKEGILQQVELLKSNLADRTKLSFRISSPSSPHLSPPGTAISQRDDRPQLDNGDYIGPRSVADSLSNLTNDPNSADNICSWTRRRTSFVHTNSEVDQSAGDTLHLTRTAYSVDTAPPYTDATFGHRTRAISARSTPTLLTSSDISDDSVASDSNLCLAIEHACCQLESCVELLINSTASTNTCTNTPAGSLCSKSRSATDFSDTHPPGMYISILNPMDLMPKLAAVTTHLSSDKPALWVFAFSRLIELLKPPPGSLPSSVEPPSPFELQNSGVTAALLSYLTESQSREIRLQIVYRMFFGTRAKSTARLLPACTALHMTKKRNTTKNGPHLMPLSPSSLSSGDKVGCIRDLDDFIDRHLEECPSRFDCGPEAFSTLVNCLLACFHRHEHFQVIGVPTSLPAGSKLLSVFHSYWLGSDALSQSSASIAIPDEGVHGSSKGHQPQKLCEPTSSYRTSSRGRSQRAHSSKSNGVRTPHTCSSQSDTREVESKYSHYPPSLVETQLAPPSPGFVWIDLVRLVDAESQNHTSQKTNSFRCSTSAFSKNGRKSSTSSTSSNLSTISASGFETNSSIPNRLSLHITALATFHLLERLILQRNEINTLFHDGLPQDHDYGFPSFPEGYSNFSSREIELRGLLDPVIRNDDDGTDGSGEHSEDRIPTVFNMKLPPDAHTNTLTVKRSHASGRLNRSRDISGQSYRVNPDRILKFDGIEEAHSSVPTTLGPVVSLDSHAQRNSPLLSLPSSETACPPALQLNMAACSHVNLVSPGIFIGSNREPTQRSLRRLLQRSAEIPPLVKFDLRNEANLKPCNSQQQTQPHKSTESWSLRRRSIVRTTNSQQPSASPEPPNTLGYGVDLRTPSHEFRGLLSSRTSPFNLIHREGAEPDVSSLSNPQKSQSTISFGSARYRRLKSSSILAAFGALANLSSNSFMPSSNDHKQHSSITNKSCTDTSTTAVESCLHYSTRRSCPGTSVNPTSSSTSSMSPNSNDSGCTSRERPRSHVVFYIGGHKLPPQLPLFEAIRRFSPDFNRHMCAFREGKHTSYSIEGSLSSGLLSTLTEREIEELTGHLMWSMRHVIQYRLVTYSSSTSTSGSVLRKTDPAPTHSLSAYLPKPFMNLSTKTSGPVSLSFAGSPTTFSSTVTCLKRRRSEEIPDSPLVTSNKFSACYSRAPSCQTLNTFPTTSHSGILHKFTPSSPSHPLVTHLTRDLPRTTLSAARCLCESASTIDSPDEPCAFYSEDDDAIDEVVSQPLALLRVLYHISCLWYTTHDLLDPFPLISPLNFHSSKVSIKASRQLQDVFNLLAGNLPSWLIRLVSTCPFLFPFEIRRTFLYAYNFDRDRMLLRLQDSTNSSIAEFEQQLSAAPRTSTTPASLSVRDGSTWGSASPNSVGSTLGSEPSSTTLVSSSLSSVSSTCWSVAIPGGDSVSPALLNISGTHRHDLHRQTAIRSRYHTRLALSPNLRRHKVTVYREGKRLLRQAEATLTELLDSRAVLEIAFDGEVGFGLGPTLEFYTLVSKQLMRSSLGLWHGNEVTTDGYVISPAPGLYPRPLSRQARSSVVREIRSKFLFLGRLLARALLDWRQLDLAFSPAFFKWFLAPTPTQAIAEGHILPNDLMLVDPELCRHITQLTEIANRHETLCHRLEQVRMTSMTGSHAHCSSGTTPSRHGVLVPKSSACSRTAEGDELLAALLALDNDIQELCLTFVLPGYEIELLKNGSHILVTGSNLKDYLRLVAHWLVIEGAIRQMEAVIDGFDSVLPGVRHRLAVLFRPEEMEGLFCGRSSSQADSSWPIAGAHSAQRVTSVTEGWDVQSLTEACRCDHGYTPQSRTIRNLFEVMSEFTEEQRRLFVQFVTGSPRLPVGGFRALKPPLKIVMKREDGENADGHLPSVMTCQNYLKLPDYSTKELLFSKLLYAIHEGQNAFHLS